ncbi:MAG: ABC transporter permease [Ignavibacteria bacterium]|jgi:putative ABC transport system permease protein
MLKNFFTVAIRNLLKNKIFSFINITGLAIGIACCLLIMLFVQNELSYDKFNKKHKDIYRVFLDLKIGDNEQTMAVTNAPMRNALINDFPEVVAAARFRTYGYPVMRYKDKVYSEEKFYWADSNYFEMFTAEVVAGSLERALVTGTSLVITEKIAKKYFGDENPIGKIINADNRTDYVVNAVVKDVPENSHFKWEFMGSLMRYERNINDQFWLSNNFYTFVQLREGTDYKAFEKKMRSKFLDYIGPAIQSAIGVPYEEMVNSGSRYEYKLMPLTDIHLNSHMQYELEPNSDSSYVYIFSIIALSILFIAVINFMNLSTAKSAGRAREVGIRKTLGSTFNQLVKQFLSESILMSFIAVFLSIAILYILLPTFNTIANRNIEISLLDNLWLVPLAILFAIVVGVFAGSYPAFFLASFRPTAVLSGKLKKGSKSGFLRSALVVIQFSVSIILIIGTIIIYNQLTYLQNKNLGFNKDQLLIVHKTDDIGTDVYRFIKELEEHPNIISASNSGSLPGLPFSNNAHKNAKLGSEENVSVWQMWADVNFAKTFQLNIEQGRYYREGSAADSQSVVINKAAVKAFRLPDNPIGEEITELGRVAEENRNLRIIGVVENFNFESLHSEIGPVILSVFWPNGFGRYLSVRIAPGNINSTIDYIESKWHNYAGKQAFEYSFFDDDFAKLYAAEETSKRLFTAFSILAIFIACLGLLGLAAYTSEQRTKEIGIRKTLGASVVSILVLLSREFTKWIIIANLTAWPLAYYMMNNWLQNFHYRIEISWITFIASGVAALLVALITVSTQALKAAYSNPVDSLKYE